MSIFRIFVAFGLVGACVVGTVGCSGGGDGGGGDQFLQGVAGLPPVPNVDITVANAQAIAATVVRAVDQALDVETKIGGQLFPSLPSAPDLLSRNSKFELFATLEGNMGSVTDTCAVSGTVTVSAPSYNNTSLSPGDKFDLVFGACDDGDGYALDGHFSLMVRTVDGDPRTDVFRLIYEVLPLMTLTVASGVENYTARGSFWLHWDSLAFPEIVLTSTPDFKGLNLSSQADVYTLSFAWQALTLNADTSVSATRLETTGMLEANLESAFLGGAISYEIIVPLQAPDGQDPESGEIFISESDQAGSIRIVIESSTSVRLDIDSDGDGIVDDFQYTTWAALQG
jgi:hypothetical protein